MTDTDRAVIQAALARVRSSTPAELPAALDALAAVIPAGPAPVVIDPPPERDAALFEEAEQLFGTPEPELDQAALANGLIEAVRGDVAYQAADAAYTRVCAALRLENLRVRHGSNDPGQDRWVSHRAEEYIRTVMREAAYKALVEAVGPLEFHRGWIKNQAARLRVY